MAMLENAVKRPKLTRRDFLKSLLAAIGFSITTPELTACGKPYQPDSSFISPETIPLGFLPNPYFSVEGEPGRIDHNLQNQINAFLQPITVENGKVPNHKEATVSQWNDWTIVKVPDMVKSTTVVAIHTSGASAVFDENRHQTSGIFDTAELTENTDIDTTKNSDDAIITTRNENFLNFIERKGINDTNLPSDVYDALHLTSKRIGVSVNNAEVDLPGNASFIYNIANVLNTAYKTIESSATGLTLSEAEARFNVIQSDILDFVLLNNVSKLPALNNQLPPDMVDHIKNLNARFAPENRTDSVKSPDVAVEIIKSIGVIESLLYYPSDTPEAKDEKERKMGVYKWLSDNDPFGLWSMENISDEITKGKENFWLDIPEVKPRGLIVHKEKYIIETNDKGEVTKSTTNYKEELILLSPGSWKSIYEEENKNKHPEKIFSDVVYTSSRPTSPDDLIAQGYDLLENEKEGWTIKGIYEIDNSMIRLYIIPDEKNPNLSWGLPLKGNGEKKEATTSARNLSDFWGDVAKLFSSGHKCLSQKLMLENGQVFENVPFQWATDLTDIWKENTKNGVKKLTHLGLMPPQDFLSKADQGFYLPKNEGIKDLVASWFYDLIINRKDPPIAWGNVIEGHVPIIDISTGKQTEWYLEKGDFFHFFRLGWNNAIQDQDGMMPYLIISPDSKLAIPLDETRLQLISSGVLEMKNELLKKYLPYYAMGFLTGLGIYSPLSKLGSYISKIF